MKLTIAGSGDAFGSGGRLNTCFLLETAKATLLVDCGASAMPALKKQGIDPNRIDAIVLSHLHGDHFGGLPFLLLDAQFLSRRERPLLIAGPPGTRARLDALLEVFFPKSTGSKWRFAWRVEEIAIGIETDVLGHSLSTAEVIHQSGAPSTALRIIRRQEDVRLFRRHRMDRCARADRCRRRPVHLRMLRLCRQDRRPHNLGNPQKPSWRAWAPSARWSRT